MNKMDKDLEAWFLLNEGILKNPKNTEELKSILQFNKDLRKETKDAEFFTRALSNMKGFTRMNFDNPSQFSSSKNY